MKLKLLYVEDDVDDQEILRRHLTKSGLDFELETCLTGGEGLGKLGGANIDLIVLDYRLPDMTGLEYLDELKNRGVKTPVIFVTGKGDERIAVEAIKRGALDYIVKSDIDISKILKSLRDEAVRPGLLVDVPLEFNVMILDVFTEFGELSMDQMNIVTFVPFIEDDIGTSRMYLKKLVETGVLTKAPIKTVLACPSCGSYTYETQLRCPKCKDVMLMRGESKMQFQNSQSLHHWYKCSNEHISTTLNVVYKCRDCRKEYSFEDAKLETIECYKPTVKGMPILKLLGLTEKRKNSVTGEIKP